MTQMSGLSITKSLGLWSETRRGLSSHFFRGEGREVAEKGAGLTPAPSVPGTFIHTRCADLACGDRHVDIEAVFMKMVLPLLLGASALLLAGCSSAKPKPAPVHERGWIGGDYEVVTQFPRTFTNAPKAALLITALNANTPASLAGFHAGDLILEINHRPAKKLRTFYRAIDKTSPGTLLPVKVWHAGHSTERDVLVGKETYNLNGIFSVGLPGFFHRLQLWPLAVPGAGFSVGVAGYRPERVSKRKELTSAEERYFKSCDPKHYQPTDPGWQAWLVIMQAETNKRIRSQEVVPAATASPPQAPQGTSVATLRN